MDAADSAPSHYQVLNVSTAVLDAQHDPSALLKRAYHRALLQNHPDKATSSTTLGEKTSPKAPYSIDQITAAFNTLSSPRRRREYDAAARLAAGRTSNRGEPEAAGFQTGVENVDLDDLAFDDALQSWYRPCRCGNERGYHFNEDDLVEAGDEGELMVGCLDCSLWLRVHFTVVEEDDSNNLQDQPEGQKAMN
jgi:curved DNA-binding protein CbpA